MNFASLPCPSDEQTAAWLPRLCTGEWLARWAPGSDGAEVLETHMSWVLRGRRHVLKLKKPLQRPFLDFSTAARRLANCREEVRLNARLAPGVYLGVLVLRGDKGSVSLTRAPADPGRENGHPDMPAPGELLEAAVWMRRLPARRMLDAQLLCGHVAIREIDALRRLLAGFYLHAARAAVSGVQHLALLRDELQADAAVLRALPALSATTKPLLVAAEQALRLHAPRLLARVDQGRIVEGHGDLRPEHVCLLRPPMVIDALEFNAALRAVDPLDELVGLGLECTRLGAGWIGPRLIAGALGARGDTPDPALVRLYTLRRALLRARLAAAHLLEPGVRTPQRWLDRTAQYLALGSLAARSPVAA